MHVQTHSTCQFFSLDRIQVSSTLETSKQDENHGQEVMLNTLSLTSHIELKIKSKQLDSHRARTGLKSSYNLIRAYIMRPE